MVFHTIILSSIVFTLCQLATGKTYPCDKTFPNAIVRQFYHSSPSYLISNIFAFTQSSFKLTQTLGIKRYSAIVTSIFALDVISNFYLYGIDLVDCSMGFSSVVFGLIAYESLYYKKINMGMLLDITIMILPSLFSTRKIFWGNVSGMIVGIIVYFIFSHNNKHNNSQIEPLTISQYINKKIK